MARMPRAAPQMPWRAFLLASSTKEKVFPKPSVVMSFIGHDSAPVHEQYVSPGEEALRKTAKAFPNLL